MGQTFSREDVRAKVIPAYMGLIKQADDQMGRLFAFLEKTGHMINSMIVITSDHGDYLGDHWQSEKDLFHKPSVKVPLIVHGPSPEADTSRGTTCDALVATINLAPTHPRYCRHERQKRSARYHPRPLRAKRRRCGVDRKIPQ